MSNNQLDFYAGCLKNEKDANFAMHFGPPPWTQEQQIIIKDLIALSRGLRNNSRVNCRRLDPLLDDDDRIPPQNSGK